jgi:hypothetical protein
MSKRLFANVGLLLCGIVLGGVLQPFRILPTEAQGGCRAFPETGKSACGRFLDYWTTHGGLAQQGYPISNEFQEVSDLNGQTYTVQYFERSVFEKHPENAAPNDVLLSQLGTFQFKRKYPGGDPSGGSVPAPPAATQQPAPPAGEQPIIFNGTTSTKTDAFNLSGGNYKATVAAQARIDFGCYYGAALRSTDPNRFVFESLANKALAASESFNNVTNIYNAKPGNYYIDVTTSSCTSWSITIAK